MPQNPPRNVNWASSGKWVHVAKVAFEKYFLHKVRAGTTEPYYEKVGDEAARHRQDQAGGINGCATRMCRRVRAAASSKSS